MPRWDALWIDGNVATLAADAEGCGAVYDAAVAVSGGAIAWIGARSELPGPAERMATTVHSMGGGWLTPGLIDAHTHLVFAGNRIDEFRQRQNGASYEEIARAGGGVQSTVAATRAADAASLLAQARHRALALLAGGVTTIEVKSGYGLDLPTERRLLQTARALASELPITISTSFLGAHAAPPEFVGRADDYIEYVCGEMLPALAADGLIDAVDGYCESIAFGPAQIGRVFDEAARLGLRVRLHADQFADGGGAELAARFNALSADHLEYTSENGVAALAAAGCIAVMLPGACYALGQERRPPVALLRRYQVPMAVATDCNPGTSPTLSLTAMMNMACRLFGLTPEESLAGTTRVAAQALGLEAERGTLEPGRRADMVLWDIGEPAELSYWLGGNPPVDVIVNGLSRADLLAA